MRGFDDELRGLSEVLFDFDLPSDIQTKYERKIFGNVFTLKQQFFGYCIVNNKEPKFEESKNRELAKKYLDRFIDKNKENEVPDFSVFDDLLFVHKFTLFLV